MRYLFLFSISCFLVVSCQTKQPQSSSVTGLVFDEKNSFQLHHTSITSAPNLIKIPSGRFCRGRVGESSLTLNQTSPKTVLIPEFYIDDTEIANIHWLEYCYFTKKDSSEEVYQKALPDTLVWNHPLTYGDPYIENYFRYPGFRYFPVVGISFEQANEYCLWRTAFVNKKMKKEAGIDTLMSDNELMQTGVVFPHYRLPTEVEWEYAAYGVSDGDYSDRLYHWKGQQLSYLKKKDKAESFYANFKILKEHVNSHLPDVNDNPDYIYHSEPNDFGLYQMCGNVYEWTTEKRINRKGEEEQVIKGGSWNHSSEWLKVGARQYMKKDSSNATTGFRCAMSYLGQMD